MAKVKTLTLAAALLAGATAMAFAQNGPATGSEPPIAGGAAASNPSASGGSAMSSKSMSHKTMKKSMKDKKSKPE